MAANRSILSFNQWDGLAYHTEDDGTPLYMRQIPVHEHSYTREGVHHRDVTYSFNPPRAWQPTGVNQ